MNIVVPPLTSRSVFFVRGNKTFIGERITAIKEDSEDHKMKVRKIKEDRLKKLP